MFHLRKYLVDGRYQNLILCSVVHRHDLLFTAFVRAFVNFASESVYFSGKDRVLYQPEFEDINKLKSIDVDV